MTADRSAQFDPSDPAMGRVRCLRASEVSALLGVDTSTVWRWVARVENALPCIRFGPRCTRFRVKDVAAFIEANANRGARQ